MQTEPTPSTLTQLFQKRLLAVMRWHLLLWLPLSFLAMAVSLRLLDRPLLALLLPALLLALGFAAQHGLARLGWKRWWALAALCAGDPPPPEGWNRAGRARILKHLRRTEQTMLTPRNLLWIRLGGGLVLLLLFSGVGLSMVLLLKRPLLALIPVGVAGVFTVSLLWASLLEGVLWFFLHLPRPGK